MTSVIRGDDDFDSAQNGWVTHSTIAAANQVAMDFDSIPSWATEFELIFSRLSTNATSQILVQPGTGGAPTTTGYLGGGDSQTTGTGIAFSATNGLVINRSGAAAAASSRAGIVRGSKGTGNTWTMNYMGMLIGANQFVDWSAADIALAGALDFVRVTTINGAEQFDAGNVTLRYRK